MAGDVIDRDGGGGGGGTGGGGGGSAGGGGGTGGGRHPGQRGNPVPLAPTPTPATHHKIGRPSQDTPVIPTLPPLPPVTPIVPDPLPPQGPNRTDVFVPVNDPLPVIYGAVGSVGAQIWYDKVQPDGSRVVLYAICHGTINSLSNMTIEGKDLSYFNMTAGTDTHVYTGTSGQTLDSFLSAAEPAFTGAFPYVAYIVAKFPIPAGTQPLPDVRAFLVDVQGMLVRDPRTDATLVTRYYRDNNALCIADFMSSPSRTAADGSLYYYGAGMADSLLDWAGTWTTAANDCDVVLADGTSKRFTLGQILSARLDWQEHVTTMRVQAQLLAPVFNSFVYQLVMDKAQAASGIVLTDTGAGANIVTTSSLVVKGSAQCPTHVVASFVNPAAQYKNDTAFDDDAGVAGGTVELVANSTNYQFGAIPYDQVKRLLIYIRKRLNLDKSATLYLLQDGGIQLLPGMRVAVTSTQLGWTSQDVVITGLKTSQNPNWSWEASVELYDASIFSDAQQTRTSDNPLTGPSPYDAPPDIIDSVTAISTTNATIYWSQPVLRSTTLYGGGSWASTGHTSFTAAGINDGVLTVQSLGWNSAVTANVSVDLGSAKQIREWWVSFTGSSSGLLYRVEYSDDNSTWFNSAYSTSVISVSGSVTTAIHRIASSVGSHRYWRMIKTVAYAETAAFTELWPREYTAVPYPLVDSYRIYRNDGGGGGFVKTNLFGVIPARFLPNSTNAVDLNAMATHIPANYNTAGDDHVGGIITVVSISGKESAGSAFFASQAPSALGGQAPTATQASQTVTLANGLNSDIATAAGRGLIEITGPTGAFSIGGFTNPQPGEIVRLFWQGSQTATIVNQDASSTAANRIITLTGANIVFAAFSAFYVELEYSSLQSRFVMKSARDSTGPK